MSQTAQAAMAPGFGTNGAGTIFEFAEMPYQTVLERLFVTVTPPTSTVGSRFNFFWLTDSGMIVPLFLRVPDATVGSFKLSKIGNKEGVRGVTCSGFCLGINFGKLCLDVTKTDQGSIESQVTMVNLSATSPNLLNKKYGIADRVAWAMLRTHSLLLRFMAETMTSYSAPGAQFSFICPHTDAEAATALNFTHVATAAQPSLVNMMNSKDNYQRFHDLQKSGQLRGWLREMNMSSRVMTLNDLMAISERVIKQYTAAEIYNNYHKKPNGAYLTLYLPYLDYRGRGTQDPKKSEITQVMPVRFQNRDGKAAELLEKCGPAKELGLRPQGKTGWSIFLPWEIFGADGKDTLGFRPSGEVSLAFEVYLGSTSKVGRLVAQDFWLKAVQNAEPKNRMSVFGNPDELEGGPTSADGPGNDMGYPDPDADGDGAGYQSYPQPASAASQWSQIQQAPGHIPPPGPQGPQQAMPQQWAQSPNQGPPMQGPPMQGPPQPQMVPMQGPPMQGPPQPQMVPMQGPPAQAWNLQAPPPGAAPQGTGPWAPPSVSPWGTASA